MMRCELETPHNARRGHLAAILLGLWTAPALGATAPPSAPQGPSLLPLLLVFAFVLSIIPVALWALKRLNASQHGQVDTGLAVVSQLSLGPRERIVVLEAGERWILLGVTSSSIQRIGSLPKGAASAPPAVPSFSSLLQRFKK